MKKFILIFAVLIPMVLFSQKKEYPTIFDTMKGDDKIAILVTHFGTTHDDTRKLTIDAITNAVKEKYKNIEVREAWTSRIIIKRIKDKKNIIKQNPRQALMQLYVDGYTHVIVQPSTLLDGLEMKSLKIDTYVSKKFFKDLRIGNQVLATTKDYNRLIDAAVKGNKDDTAYIWVGHGTSNTSTAQYTMIDYMLREKGIKNCFVGTIEGFPGFEDLLKNLKKTKFKKVVLVPFMIVAGEHAENDISDEWRNKLEKAGYSVSVKMEGLGQNKEVQNIILSHINHRIHHEEINIMNKKSMYANTGEKME